jgi:endonuclease YncB( thermonuclease family)
MQERMSNESPSPSTLSDLTLLTSLQRRQNPETLDKSSLRTDILMTLITSAEFSDNNVDTYVLRHLDLDKVERIVDANTIQLQKKGLVKLAMVRMPSISSNFQFPDCFEFSPSYKVRQLIPKNTAVRVQTIGGKPHSVVLVREQDSLIVNRELVKTGFAKVIKPSSSSAQVIDSKGDLLDTDELLALQNEAQAQGLGIFSRCDAKSPKDGGGISQMPIVEAQFEPLERTMETVWTDDGGKRQLRKESSGEKTTPANPGDIKGCSDFKTYEEALQWYEAYEPFCGDVAKLDRDGDGVPCPGLPHTTNQNMYRMKIPKSSTQ